MEKYAQADTLKNITTSELYQTDGVFSGLDIVAYVTLPGKKTYRLGTLNLLAISTHRDKFPVTSLGKVKVRGFTGGHRTVAGTMVFSSFDSTVWYRMMETYLNDKSNSRSLDRFLPDELPPFDISVSFINEMGRVSYTGVLGATILDEGETYSIDNIAVMETYSYMAIDRIPFQPYDIFNDKNKLKEPTISKKLAEQNLYGNFGDYPLPNSEGLVNSPSVIAPYSGAARIIVTGATTGSTGSTALLCPDGSMSTSGPNGTYICNGIYYCPDGSVAHQTGNPLSPIYYCGAISSG